MNHLSGMFAVLALAAFGISHGPDARAAEDYCGLLAPADVERAPGPANHADADHREAERLQRFLRRAFTAQRVIEGGQNADAKDAAEKRRLPDELDAPQVMGVRKGHGSPRM